MLTARIEEGDKVRGLDLGADDYITKPFGVRASGPRARRPAPFGVRREDAEVLRRRPAQDRLRRLFSHLPGEERQVDPQGPALLAILSRNKGRVALREQLLDQVWGLEYYGEARTLDVHISGLRKKLGACGGCIETVIGIGYRFRPGAESAETSD